MNKKNNTFSVLILVWIISTISCLSQQKLTADALGFKHYSIVTDSLGTINYYVTKNKIDSKKPLLIYLDGSGAYPLFQKTQRGLGSTVPLKYQTLSNDYHIILISKPGVPFIDEVKMNYDLGYPEYKNPKEYDQKLSLEWRVESTDKVINDVLKKLNVDTSKIAILGISEGFQVGAKLLTVNNKITHAALLVGNGLNQFYDFIIQNRIEAQKGKITAIASQKNIDSLFNKFKDIYLNQQSTDKNWYGHTYLRWASFCKNIPSENILSSDIPIYIIACSDDINTSVLGTDYLYLDALRKGKKNIIYEVLPYNHFFQEIIKDENGNIISKERHMDQTIEKVINWINSLN